MHEVSREVQLDIQLDLDIFDGEYGCITEQTSHSSTIGLRRRALRDYVGAQLFKFNEFLGERSLRDVLDEKEKFSGDLEYILDYLRTDGEVSTDLSFYTMKLIERQDVPNAFTLVIILNEGFLSFMETSSSENFNLFLQEILRCLYESNVTNYALVNYYMELGHSPTKLFKIAI